MSFLRTLASAATAAALGVTLTPLSAHAAETISSSGWICTTDALPAVPPNGAGLAKVRAIRPSVTFDASSRMTMRFAAPVPAGATIRRTGGGSISYGWRTSCPTIGLYDQNTSEGQRYRYEISAPQRQSTAITVGNRLPAVTNRGRVVLVIDEAQAAEVSWAIDGYYIPQLEALGWSVVKELVSPTMTAQAVRARLAQRVAEDATTKAAFLIGRIPVVHSGNDLGAGARPTDTYYADVNGSWTDSFVNTPNPVVADRRNVPGDGKFDQDIPPSPLELAVGRLDPSNLPDVTRDDSPLGDEASLLWSYLLRSSDARVIDSGDIRRESFLIDDGNPGAAAGTPAWQAASALGGLARAGTRAELDTAATAGDWTTRPTMLFQHGRGTSTSLSTWTGTTPGDIAGLSSVGRARFVVSAGAGVREWHRPNALSRATVAGWTGADAATADHLDTDGLALGDTLGASFNVGIQEAVRGGDRLGTLIGDPTTTLYPAGYTDQPTASVAGGCTDAKVAFTVLGVPSNAAVTADVYRSVNGGAFTLVGRNAAAAWSEDQGLHHGTFTDAGVMTANPNADVVYEVRPRALHTTGRGSFFVNAPSERSASLRLRCAWTCDTPTSANPTDAVERSRSQQLESRTTFTDGGRTARIALDRRHTGRTVTGQRIDVADIPTAEACVSTQAAAAFKADNLVPGAISEFQLQELPNGVRVPVLIGHELPARYDRGTVVVVTERTVATSPLVIGALQEYREALEADGFDVASLMVERTDTVASVRSRLKALYDAAPQRTKSAVLIGHVPVPYSGTGAYDGHGEHNGAWSTDAPYADLNGTWTDATVNITTSARTQNRNIPGDGKFDQNTMPSQAELAVGRIDFFDMPSLGTSEAQLTADYLRRDLQYRRGQLEFKNAAFTKDNFGFFPAGVLANVSPVVGAANVRVNRSTADARVDARTGGPYLLAYAAGPGGYQSSGGVGTTTDPVPALFMGSLGSYYGDWDSRDNFLRGHLAKNLGAMWENWSVDGMALGESIGDTVQRHMDRSQKSVRNPLNSFLGDPTLRAYPLKNVTDLNAWDEGSCQYSSLTWTPSTDTTIDGYVIERKYSDGWKLITQTPLPRTATGYEDHLQRGFYSGVYYRVRPVRKDATSRGSFTNLGQGALAYAGSCD